MRSDGEHFDKYMEMERNIPEPENIVQKHVCSPTYDYDDHTSSGLFEEY
jgi:hypothetical protein